MKSRKRWDGTFADWEPIARRIAAGQNRARAVRTGHRWPKKARELYAGRHVWRFLAKNPAPAVPWGRNLGIGVILELSFPSSECRCKGVYEPGTADPEENPSKIAVRARFLANWRGRREACTSGDSILEPVRSSRGCNEGDDGVLRGWEAQSREARAAPVPLPGL